VAALTKQDLATIGSLLENDKPVRNHFSGYGRLHIDRQLPFLTVYRKPKDTADKGTHRLLLGEASYLILENLDDWHMQLNQLVGLIQKTQNTVFGGFLLLEIWARPDSELENEHPEFRIFAPKQNCPGILLERFESALLRISVNELEASVTTEYTDAVRPPSLEAIINTRIEPGSNFIHLGLEVKPIYRDSSNTLFPFELKELRHELNRALKRLYYEFTHIGTSHRPGHYHELGRRAITKSAHNSDKQLADISNKFDLILHVTPVNTPEAWARFKDNQFQRIPEFLYRARPIDPDLLKRQLYKIPLERIEDPTLAHIFSEKREELDRQISLIADRNTKRFVLGSRQLFGDVEPGLLASAEDILTNLSADSSMHFTSRERLSAEEFCNLAQYEIQQYREQDDSFDSKAVLRDDVSGLLVSQGNLLIGKDCRIHKARAAAVLAHEVGTHLLTYHNGRQQPFEELYTGMAGYEPMQEGLAVLSEYLVGKLDPARIRTLAARVMAVKYITDGADFVEAFSLLCNKYGFEPQSAFYITMRVYRGGGYTKDIVYLRGLSQVLEYLASGKELESLYLGKLSYEHLVFIQELKWRKVLKGPRLRPLFLDTPLIDEKLQKLGDGLTVLDLIEKT